MQINEKITNLTDLYNHFVMRDGFVFTSICDPTDVYDAIVIRYPETARCYSPIVGVSSRSIDEHIRLINQNKLCKALIIAEKLDFLDRCPTLTHLEIVPAFNINGNLDLTQLYKQPKIQYLNFPRQSGLKINGIKEGKRGPIDFSNIIGLEELSFEVSKTDSASHPIHSLKKLSISKFKSNTSEPLQGLFDGGQMSDIDFTQCNLTSLKFLKNCTTLSDVSINYDRAFSDLLELYDFRDTIEHLSIYNCSKIINFGVISNFYHLLSLHLWGSNQVSDLSFLRELNQLKIFTFDMNVINGDLSFCLNIPYVYSAKDRRHYNYKDAQLPKKNEI